MTHPTHHTLYHTLKRSLMRGITLLAAFAALTFFGLSHSFAMGGDDDKIGITITNNMDDELLAPIVIAPVRSDDKIFVGNYVSAAAEHQILTGDPMKTVEMIGRKATVGHGTDGPPGVLLAPGKSITISVKAKKGQALRILAMVAPTRYADHFVTGIINVGAGIPITLDRLDIGHDEGRMMTEHLRPDKVTAHIEK